MHWGSRLSVLAVLVVLLWWQSRYTWSVRNPMHGWPMPFNNTWYGDFGHQWRPAILIVDIAVWLVLAGSVGYVLERWRRKPRPLQVTLGGLLILHAVAAGILAFGCIEGYLRANPNNGSIFPRYARWRTGAGDVWFDVGLFTDFPQAHLLTRITIILAIGCTIYATGHLLHSVGLRVWRIMGVKAAVSSPSLSRSEGTRLHNPCPEPIAARVLTWLFGVMIAGLSMATLLPPAIQ